jgi:hypothetical protein
VFKLLLLLLYVSCFTLFIYFWLLNMFLVLGRCILGTRNDRNERLKSNNNEDEGRKFDFHVEFKVSFMFT